MAKKKKTATKTENGLLIVALNKKARHDYEIVETVEAGIVLVGSEVKSIRDGGVTLKESYVKLIRSELYLVGCHISPYSHSPVDAHEVRRDRKLLLHKREIEKLALKTKQKGLTIVPVRMYFKKGRCKLEIGLGRGKSKYDKREAEKAREAKRAIARAFD